VQREKHESFHGTKWRRSHTAEPQEGAFAATAVALDMDASSRRRSPAHRFSLRWAGLKLTLNAKHDAVPPAAIAETAHLLSDGVSLRVDFILHTPLSIAIDRNPQFQSTRPRGRI
jgi:hypothetical protein